MKTPNPYRTRVQATQLAESDDGSQSEYQRRLDDAARTLLLDAYKAAGNKYQAAKVLGLTYRAFRYHWTRLIQD